MISYYSFIQDLSYTYGSDISATGWKRSANGTRMAYDFSYDGLHRLKDAVYKEGSSVNNHYTEKVTGYDRNGNITTLQRYGRTGASSWGVVDNLTLTRTGNQLTSVSDSGSAAYSGDFNAAAGASTYNANGALATDSGRGISSVTWNEIDLPQTVTFSNGSTINYYYAADGTKLREVRTVSGTATTIDWCGVCAGNPMNVVDKDGLFPIWPIIFALADYGMQVSDNYNQGLRGYDMLLGEINVAEVILSAVPVSKGSTIAQLGKTFAKEAFKAGIKYTPNDKFDVNENVSDVLSRAIISTTADAAVGRLLEFGSEAATTAAKKASESAAKKAIHDANIAANRSRSTVRATRAETSQGVAHVARADYLERKIVNGTLVKAPELTKMAASTTAEKVYEIIDPLSVDKSGYFYLTGFGK